MQSTACSPSRRTLPWIPALLLALWAAGCAGPDRDEAPPDPTPCWGNLLSRVEPDRAAAEEISADRDLHDRWEREVEFLAAIQAKARVSLADGIRCVALSMGIPVWNRSTSDLAGILAERGVVRGSWQAGGNVPLTKGKIAYMICQACCLRGGLWMTLFGPSERYCLKEAINRKIITPGSTHRFISGGELLDIISQADCLSFERPGLTAPRSGPGQKGGT